MRTIAILLLLSASFCFAHGPIDFKPASSNVLDAQFPQVDSNSRVQIRFKAPDATKVRVYFWSGEKADMEKQTDGFWRFTTNSMAPGLHYYTIVVDGAEVSDPGSTAYFGGSKWASAVEVPEAGVDYYLPKEVLHGQVRQIWYHSSVTGAWRDAFIYLPPDYDASKVHYPVLYLQHGGGEDETGWIRQGKANFILDNLIASGNTKPMIVVMANGYATRAGYVVPDLTDKPFLGPEFIKVMQERMGAFEEDMTQVSRLSIRHSAPFPIAITALWPDFPWAAWRHFRPHSITWTCSLTSAGSAVRAIHSLQVPSSTSRPRTTELWQTRPLSRSVCTCYGSA